MSHFCFCFKNSALQQPSTVTDLASIMQASWHSVICLPTSGKNASNIFDRKKAFSCIF